MYDNFGVGGQNVAIGWSFLEDAGTVFGQMRSSSDVQEKLELQDVQRGTGCKTKNKIND